MIGELRTLNPASGADLELRARCQSDGHPAGCFNPWFDGTFCHCGRVVYRGVVEVVRWPRPVSPVCGKPIVDTGRVGRQEK